MEPYIAHKLKGHILKHSLSSKYLGVEITKYLSWKYHIGLALKKKEGKSIIGFLRKNLKTENKNTSV